MKSTRAVSLFGFIGFLLAISCYACKKTLVPETHLQCIERILDKDSTLGSVRNERCKTVPLSQTNDEYCSALNELDFENCPLEFSMAFNKHILAWQEMKYVTDSHPAIRGEMHELFDVIALTSDSTMFKAKLKEIWDTWGVI